ncbi:DUF6069 family protein [Iamia majanohamensis]|uniref:DUF6069 family protein n=1 Tax=Iamia majanohamensis TaxID=467976 RepID=A0AAE9YCS6_9ACTN|nr:DUF6069 family protein [Iamia majanohamensis]WCO68818.1 DUF6069 family protein [Iamia majanohamensis]
MSTTIALRSRPRIRPSRRAQRAVAVAAATVVAAVGWADLHVLGGVDLTIDSGPDARSVGLVEVVVAAALAGLAGWAALALLERRRGRGPRSLRLWVGLGLAAMALSLVGPLTADAPSSTQWSLVALHTSTGVALLAAMARTRAGGGGCPEPSRRPAPTDAGGERLRQQVPR